ncbi:hypothetical protein H7097_01800 [Aeromicrobium sp.]|nr:hypothetical protein [Candidatus Saccharibacteria bacterium]
MADELKSLLGDNELDTAPDSTDTTESTQQAVPTPDNDAARSVEPSHEKQWKDNATDIQESNPGKFPKLKKWARGYWAKKKWTLPLTLFLLLALLLGIPLTRYPILGTIMKKDTSITVMDSVTDQPVTDASITVAGSSFKTDNHGRVMARLKVGKHDVTITKKYYKTYKSSVFVGIMKTPSVSVKAVATGRQVPLMVTDYITGRALENAVITASGSSAKTDKQGKATLVLAAKGTDTKATITRDGYNDNPVNILITSRDVTTNRFTITPTGKVYFLSNLSGKIDVVKTDLDGKNRKTVLTGTGSEDTNSTALLASRNWKYLALLSKRDGKQGVYLINTTDDSSTNIDGGNASASFTLVGWSGDTFVYQIQRANVSNWQPGAQTLKSYDAPSGKLFTLDQSQAEGTGTADYGYTNFSTVSLLNGEVVYTKNWYSSSFPDHMAGKSSSLISVHPDSTSKKTIKDFAVPAGVTYGYSVNISQYEPYGLYVQVPNNNDGTNTYYGYENGTVALKNDVTDDTWNKVYPTYLVSPTGKQSFWSDVRDNKNTLFVGNAEGANGKQIATLSGYTPYGWYSDNYLLVTKGGSELYVMPTDGSKAPSKLTDYYKPQLTYRGYGGGYGGI